MSWTLPCVFLSLHNWTWLRSVTKDFFGLWKKGRVHPFNCLWSSSSSSCSFVCCTQLDYISTSRIQRNVAYSDELYPKNCNCFGLKCMYQINLRIWGLCRKEDLAILSAVRICSSAPKTMISSLNEFLMIYVAIPHLFDIVASILLLKDLPPPLLLMLL